MAREIFLWVSFSFTVIGSFVAVARLTADHIKRVMTTLAAFISIAGLGLFILFTIVCPIVLFVGPVYTLQTRADGLWYWWLSVIFGLLVWMVIEYTVLHFTLNIWKKGKAGIEETRKALQNFVSGPGPRDDKNTQTLVLGTLFGLIPLAVGILVARATRLNKLSFGGHIITRIVLFLPLLLSLSAPGLAIWRLKQGNIGVLTVVGATVISIYGFFFVSQTLLKLAELINRVLRSDLRSALTAALLISIGALLNTIIALGLLD